MSSRGHICVVWEDTDNIMTWLVQLELDEEPEDAMRRLVLKSNEWPFNHWNATELALHASEWRCFRLVANPEVINRLKKVQWPSLTDSGIDQYTQGLHKLMVFEAFAA